MPSGADLEYLRKLNAAGVSNAAASGYDGARLEQLALERSLDFGGPAYAGISAWAWDDFIHDQGMSLSSVGRFASGQSLSVYSTGNPNDLVLSNKGLRLQGPGAASYVWALAPEAPESIFVEVEWENAGGAGADTAIAVAVSSKTDGTIIEGFKRGVHLSVSPTGWNLGYFDSADTYQIYATGTYSLIPSNMKVRTGMKRIASDRVLVFLPDGTSQVVRHWAIRRWGKGFGIEHFKPADTARNAIFSGLDVHNPQVRPIAARVPPSVALCGLPGAIPTSQAAVAITTGTTQYVPFHVADDVTITSAVAEVTTASTAGGVVSLGIYAADEFWKPKDLVLDLGTQPVDSTGVKTWVVGTPPNLPAGRYLLAQRVSADATLRSISYGLREIASIWAFYTTSPFAKHLKKTEAYAATWPVDGSAWDAVGVSTQPGWVAAAQLTWAS